MADDRFRFSRGRAASASKRETGFDITASASYPLYRSFRGGERVCAAERTGAREALYCPPYSGDTLGIRPVGPNERDSTGCQSRNCHKLCQAQAAIRKRASVGLESIS